MKKLFIFIWIFTAQTAIAQSQDFEIANPYYQTSYNKITCSETEGEAVSTPEVFAHNQVRMEKVVVSITLDRALLLLSFNADGVECRYNSIFSIDKRKFVRTLTLLESQAYSEQGTDTACQPFKTALDDSLRFTKYKIDYNYVGIMFNSIGKSQQCENDGFMTVFNRIRRR